MSDAREAAAPPRAYHLFNDHSPARTRMPTLEPTLGRINDRFARLLRAALLQHLRRGVEVSPGPIELVRHRELIERLGTPTYMTMISMKPLRGTIVIVLDVPLVTGIVESRFGGSGRFPVTMTNREFTPFELKSMRRVMEATLEQLVVAWEPFGKFEADIVRLETEPQFAGFATAEEMIIASPFAVKVDQGHGQLLVCIPYSAIEPMHEQMMSGIVEDSVDHDHPARIGGVAARRGVRDGAARAADRRGRWRPAVPRPLGTARPQARDQNRRAGDAGGRRRRGAAAGRRKGRSQR